ncbi:MAG TPA: hypothetical protein PK431_04665, partial [Chitinophagales bacterium]|nr:hypothetical protein [Chitinophagales bacterium]
ADGNYLLSGYSPSLPSGNKTTNSFGNNDYWIVKINDSGTKLSEDIFGGSSDDITTSLIATDDNGYIIGGRSASGINGNKTTANFGSNDYWVAKVAPPLVLSATPRTTTICAGNTLAIDYSITSCRDFKVGNTIKVELSDATGSFTSATLLLTQSTVASSGTLTVTIPITAVGEFYKIRVSSSSPKDTVIIGSLFTIVAQSKCNCLTDNMTIDWQQSYGGTLSDFSYVNIPTSDGGYILGGTSESGISGNKTTTNFGGTDYWIIKVDGNGIKQWEQVFGGTGNDELTSIISTTDGGYLIGGYSLSGISGNKTTANFGNNDYWIIKIDANGVKQWEKNYGGSDLDVLNSIVAVDDGTFLVGGTSSSPVSGNKLTPAYNSGLEDYWIIKIDADGNKIWEKVYGSSIADKLKTITASSDGNFWLCGISRGLPIFDKTTTNYGGQDFWIIKIDKDGTKISDYNYGGSLNETLQCAAIATDGSLILAGNTESSISGNKTTENFGNEDFWVIKIDNSGNIIWDKSYGGTNRELLSSITPTSDNGFYISGTSASGATGNKTTANIGGLGAFDYWVTKVDNNGNMIWDKSYGGTISDNLSSLLTTSDNGFIMTGFSYSTISGNKTTTNLGSSDYWLVKVAPPIELSATARTTTICAGNTLDIDYSITSCR